MNNIEDSISLTDELEMEEQLNRSMGDIDNDIDEVANDIDTIEVEAELD